MKIYDKKTIYDKLDTYCPLSEKDSYIEISEWKNSEGYDIDINGEKRFSLTLGELDAIDYLIKALQFGEKD
jgi:hypothetical protein